MFELQRKLDGEIGTTVRTARCSRHGPDVAGNRDEGKREGTARLCPSPSPESATGAEVPSEQRTPRVKPGKTGESVPSAKGPKDFEAHHTGISFSGEQFRRGFYSMGWRIGVNDVS